MSDTQMTLNGLFIAACMFLVSNSVAAKKLSDARPRSSAISPYLFASVLAQFALHLFCLARTVAAVRRYEPERAFDPDAEVAAYEPSLTNTAVFLMLLPMQVSTFAATVRGRPFLQPLTEGRRSLLLGLGGMALLPLLLALGAAPEGLAPAMELLPLPDGLRLPVVGLMLADLGGAVLLDRIAWLVFPLARGSGVYALRRQG